MFKIIRGTLTASVIVLVVVAMSILAVSSLAMSGRSLVGEAEENLQTQAHMAFWWIPRATMSYIPMRHICPARTRRRLFPM